MAVLSPPACRAKKAKKGAVPRGKPEAGQLEEAAAEAAADEGAEGQQPEEDEAAAAAEEREGTSSPLQAASPAAGGAAAAAAGVAAAEGADDVAEYELGEGDFAGTPTTPMDEDDEAVVALQVRWTC